MSYTRGFSVLSSTLERLLDLKFISLLAKWRANPYVSGGVDIVHKAQSSPGPTESCVFGVVAHTFLKSSSLLSKRLL